MITEELIQEIAKGNWQTVPADIQKTLRDAFDEETSNVYRSIAKAAPNNLRKLLPPELLEKTPKPERAALVYRYHRAEGIPGLLCSIYDISQSYYRTLRQLQKTEWEITEANNQEELYRARVESSCRTQNHAEDDVIFGLTRIFVETNFYSFNKKDIEGMYKIVQRGMEKEKTSMSSSI